MKNGLLALLITVCSLNALSQVVPDTTNITIGDKTIIVIDSNPTKQQTTAPTDNTSSVNYPEAEDQKLLLTHFAGIDLGFSRLVDESNNSQRDSATDWLSLNPSRSLTWRLNLLEQKVRLYRDYIGLLTGFSITYAGYGFQNNIDLASSDSLGAFAVAVDPDVRDYSKNKLRTTSLQIPLMLEFNTSSNPKKHFHLAFGVQGGWVTTSIQKQKWQNELGRFTSRRRDEFNIQPFTLDLAVRIGFNKTSVFVNYGLQPFFEKQVGTKVFPIVFGIQLTQF
jgi:uncharacterized glyoxalase superfamily protein PhnB